MPEIKHNFTKGKMNKDLDERLVPNGEYRHAMNIEVTTSEDSNVGTVQNLLGNQALSNHTGSGSTCVGSVADEKNDSIYWFVNGPSPEVLGYDINNVNRFYDYILKYSNTNNIEYVFVDNKATIVGAIASLTGMNAATQTIPLQTVPGAEAINVGDKLSYILTDGAYFNFSGIVTEVDTSASPYIKIDTYTSGSALDALMTGNSPPIFINLVFESNVLNFHPEKFITGINIIDDLLFWCDGVGDYSSSKSGTEPKKLHITRSIQGTNQNGLQHTKLINTDRNISISNGVDVKEEHLTVIKRPPSLSPDLELQSTRRSGDITGEFTFSFEDVNIPGYLAPSGTAITIPVTHNTSSLNWETGDILLVENTPNDPNDKIYPLRDSIVKLKITSSLPGSTGLGPYVTNVSCTIESISIETKVSSTDYLIDLQPDENSIFKYKFPKFATRYKYIDNEYSSFSPFSQVAFIPETWDYQTKKGVNLGMQNNLKKVTLKNIIPPNIPDDVTQVDILYKESNSTNIYLIDNVKMLDGTTNWTSNEFIINSELIHAALPSNQLLRPWDNVPKKALAQEVTGNRLVYGNYLQNYSALSSRTKPTFSIELNSHNTKQDGSLIDTSSYSKKFTPLRSIKSLREYQLGVVYEDDYGRQSPVFTSDSAYINVPKKESGNTNLLDISIDNEIPAWAKSFRFYVKESSDEYYTLAMDRWFDAEDGNVWLTFPSLDRNKITEESILVLKKNIDINEAIQSLSEYKVIAIKNEVPPFVKNTKVSYGLQVHSTGAPLFTSTPPLKDANFISYDGEVMEDGFLSQAVLDWSGDNRISKKMYVRFHLTEAPTDKSNYYEIASMTPHSLNGGSSAGELKIASTFGDDVDFVTDASLNVVDNISIEIARETEINKAAYDGRFFVKVAKNQDLQSSVLTYQYLDGVNIFGECNVKFLQYQGGFHCGTHWQSEVTGSGGGNIGRPASTFIATASDARGVLRTAAEWATKSIWGNAQSSFTRVGDCSTLANFPHPAPFMPDVTNLKQNDGYPYTTLTTPNSILYHDYNMDRGGMWWRNKYLSLLDPADDKGGEWFIDMEPTFKYPHTPPTEHANAGSNTAQNYKNTPGVGACLGSNRMDISYVGSEYRDGGTSVVTGDNWVDPLNIRTHKTLTRNGKIRFKGDPGQIVYTILNCRVVHDIENTHDDSLNTLGGSKGYNWDYADKGGVFRVRYELELDQEIGTTVQNEGIITPQNHPALGTYPGTLDENYTGGRPVYHWSSTTYTSSSLHSNPGSGSFYDSEKRQHDPGAGWYSPFQSSAWITGVGAAWGDLASGASDIFSPTHALWEWKNIDGTPRLGFVPTMSKGIVWPIIEVLAGGFVGSSPQYTPTWSPSGLGNVMGPGYPNPNIWDIAAFNSIDLNSSYNIARAGTGIDFSSSDGYRNGIQLAESAGGSSFGVENVNASVNPAIWETLPKESVDLELYYEASQSYPVKLGGLDSNNSKIFAPIGSIVTCDTASTTPFSTETKITDWVNNTVTIDNAATTANLAANTDILTFTKPDGSYTTALYTGSTTNTELSVDPDIVNNKFGLSYFNCFAFGNGVESNRISDTFNSVTIDKGVRVSTILEDVYEEEQRKYGLIYSGIYNSTSGINNLNQFIQTEKITKDLNPTYSSIQKLFQRRISLVAFCEDRVVKILSNKDALYNADGNVNLVSTNNVLGEAQPFVGDFGISKNPESFASESYRAYFTDKQRGAVLRLSKDGLTPISEYGMKDWFSDNLKDYDFLIGSYDNKKSEYNLTLKNYNQ